MTNDIPGIYKPYNVHGRRSNMVPVILFTVYWSLGSNLADLSGPWLQSNCYSICVAGTVP